MILRTSLTNLISPPSQMRSFSSSQKQTYIPVFPLTSIGRNNPAFIFCTSNILRNASGIIESAEIIYGFPLKNGSSSFEMFCDASIRDSLPAEQYSLIMLTVVPSIFSRNKTAAEIPRYSHASFKISWTILSKPSSDSSIRTIAVIASLRFNSVSICISDSRLFKNASCAKSSSNLTANICFDSVSKNSIDL